MDRPKYSIKTISELTGVSIDTLRNWERRYQFLKPRRNPKGVRLYSDFDVDLVLRFRALLLKGERPSDVAERIRCGETLPKPEAAEALLPSELKKLILAFHDALLSFDPESAELIHCRLRVSFTFRQRLDLVYAPLLKQLEADSAGKKIGIGEARFASGWVRGLIESFLNDIPNCDRSRSLRAVCATPKGEVSETELLILTAHLKFTGWNVFYLGSNTPVDEILRVAKLTDADMILLAIENPAALSQDLAGIRLLRKPIFVGGRGALNFDPGEEAADDLHLIRQSGERAITEILKHLASKRPD